MGQSKCKTGVTDLAKFADWLLLLVLCQHIISIIYFVF